MSRIEELPDDFDESIDLNKATPPPPKNATTQDLYEQYLESGASKDGRTFEDAMLELSKSPLFMNDLDVAKAQDGENDMLEAIRALQYEGTTAEIAQGFKERGNEMVAEKNWKDAKEFYSKGIATLLDKSDTVGEKPEDPAEETKKRKIVEEQLYVNRALCNLELKNYRSTTLDCAAALRVNPTNVKAHFRSASALFALDKIHDALDVCYRGLQIDQHNAPLKQLLVKAQIRARAKEAADLKRRAETQRKRQEKVVLNTALAARGIKLRGSERPPDLQDAVIRLSPDPLSPKSVLEFPVMLLYPLHNQSDLVKAWAEKDALSDHLSYILPLPWDTPGEYTMDKVDCYMDTATGGIMKVGKKLKLLEVLSNGKTVIVDGLVRIYVVPIASASVWIEEMKRMKNK